MKSVLDIAGLCLYLGYRFIMIPVFAFLYLLLAVVLTYNYIQFIVKQMPVWMEHAFAGLALVKQKIRLPYGWQVGWASK